MTLSWAHLSLGLHTDHFSHVLLLQTGKWIQISYSLETFIYQRNRGAACMRIKFNKQKVLLE